MLIEDKITAYLKEIGVNTSNAKADHTTEAQMLIILENHYAITVVIT